MVKFVKKPEKKYTGNLIFIIVGLVLLIYLPDLILYSFAVTSFLSLRSIIDLFSFSNNNSLKRLKKNPYVYIKNKKVKIEIIDIFKKYYKNYNKVIIKCNTKKKDKEVNISIYNGKMSFLKIVLDCWEE